ncbi:MAG: hypothetical protein ABEJ84_03600 [Halodesulfurarchaeum sp.]
MTARWYCTDCETEIEKADIPDHEEAGHQVRGAIRPDRLLGNDPWNMQVEVDGTLDSTGAVSREEGGEN